MKTRYRRTTISQYLVVGIVLVAAVGLVALSTFMMSRISFQDEFVIPWAAGRGWLLEGLSPYSEQIGRIASQEAAESPYLVTLPENRLLIEPALNLFFYLPLSLIPYTISRALWTALIAICLGGIGYFSLKLSGWKVSIYERIALIALTVFWFPGVKAVMTGQLTPVVILLVLVGIDAILHERDTLAGLAFALTFGSISTSILILLFITIWSIARRRWTIIGSFFAGLAFIWIITLMLLPSWPVEWLGVLLNTYEDWTWVRTPLMDLAALLPGIENYLSIALHALFAVYMITLWITLTRASEREFVWKVPALLVVIHLAHIQSSNILILLIFPALFVVFRFWSERWKVIGRLTAWLLIIAAAVHSWTSAAPDFSLVSDHRNLLLIVGLPIIVFIGMIWVRWWAFRIPRLPYERQ
jgi:hypothetical protein